MVLYVSPHGEISPFVAPVSRLGVDRSLVLGIEISGFVSLAAERGLRMMHWQTMQQDLMFKRLAAP